MQEVVNGASFSVLTQKWSVDREWLLLWITEICVRVNILLHINNKIWDAGSEMWLCTGCAHQLVVSAVTGQQVHCLHCIFHQPTPWNRVLFEKVVSINSLSFMEPEGLLMHTRACHWTLAWSPKQSLSLELAAKILMDFSLLHVFYITHPSHPLVR